MRVWLFILKLFSLATLLKAHSPNEITYVVEQKQDNWQLTIHLFTAAAIKIIQPRVPELKEQTIINLDDYYVLFTKYFNETIEISLEQQEVQLSLVDADLHSHDATLNFNMVGAPKSFSSYNITINSFLEIYNRPVNLVKIKYAGQEVNCNLNKQTRSCKSAIQSKTILSNNFIWTKKLAVISFIILILIVTCIYFLKIKS